MSVTVSQENIKKVKAQGFLHNKGTDNFSGRVLTTNGKITASQHKCIAKAASLFGNGNIMMTTRLTLEVQGIPFDKIEEFQAYIAKEGLKTGGTGAKIRPVVSCKGTTCQYGLLDSYAISEEIHHRFFEGYSDVALPHKFKIAVGGCPNNCVKPNLNDIGLVGHRKPIFNQELCRGCRKCAIEAACPVNAASVVDGKLHVDQSICKTCGRCIGKCYFNSITDGTYGIQIYIGGRWGKDIAIGKPLSKTFETVDEALNVVEKAILLYKEQGIKGERFSTTIERIGFDKAEALLLSDEILARKNQILQ